MSSETHNDDSIPSTPPYGGADSVDPIDSCYFSYFVSSMPHILNYIIVFPTLFGDILSRGVQDVSVRHSILSIASFLADHRLNRSIGRFELNYIKSLQVIQRSIAEVRVDESLAIAVFLIAWVDAARGQYEVCRKHLRGLSIILQQVQPICQNPVARTDRISPLIMLIWRFAIRMDCSVSFFAFQQPVFPMMPPAEDLHREWIRQVSGSSDALEWALAAFALDNLFHRTCHYAIRVHHLRGGKSGQDQEVEKKVSSIVERLQTEIIAWYRRPVIDVARRLEDAIQPVSPPPDTKDPDSPSSATSSAQFLHYPELRIRNPLYANLLMTWHALSIFLSLIREPNLDLAFSLLRFKSGVEVCRILAAIEADRAPAFKFHKVWAIFLAQVSFGGNRRSPREVAWLSNQINKLSISFPLREGGGLRVFERFWDAQGDFWEELAKVGFHVDPND